jgi:hypothetical protein
VPASQGVDVDSYNGASAVITTQPTFARTVSHRSVSLLQSGSSASL